MSKLLKAAIAMLLLSATAVGAKTPTPEEVMAHHIDVLKKYDLDAIMEDYADDAVAVYASGIHVGKPAIRKLMESFAPFKETMAKMEVRMESLGHGTIAEHFVINAGTPKEVKGVDVMVIKNGKIVFQANQPKPPIAPAAQK